MASHKHKYAIADELVDDFAGAVVLVGLIGIPNEMTPAPDG